MSDEAIIKSIKYVDSLLSDEQSMIDTINTEHPDFIAGASQEYDCWKMHDLNLMKLTRIKRQLCELSTTKAELEESRKANKRQPPCEQFCESRAFKSTIAKLEKELDKIKNHLAIEESECVRLCNEKNKLQAERAKAGDIKAEAVEKFIEYIYEKDDSDSAWWYQSQEYDYIESLKPKGNNNEA